MSDPKPAPKRWRDKFRDLSTLRRRVRAPPAGERQSSPNVSPPVGPLSATRFPLKQPNLWGRALESLFQDESKEKLLRKYEESILNQDSPHVANAAQAQNTALSSIGGASGSVWRQTLRDRADEARAAVQISTAENVKTHLANAVDIILVFEGVAGSVASLDPNAALAWSGACFLLTLVARGLRQAHGAAEGLKDIVAIMRRYHDLEKTIAIPHHASSVIPGTTLVIDQFEDHVVEMYTNILEYQLRLVIFYQRSEFTKIARHTDDWQGLLTTIRKLERESRKDKDVMNDGILKDLHEDVWDNMKSALSTNYEDTKLLVEVAVAGTCDWFTSTTNYERWRCGPTPFMFLIGGPYSGKSVLLKHLYDKSFRDGISCYQFFYPTVAGDGDSIAHGLAAILHQLCRNQKLESISRECLVRHKDRIRDLRDNMSLLWEAIIEIANKSNEDIFCFIDGLDCASSKKPMDRIMFTSMVNNYYKSVSNPNRLRMLISARPDLKKYHNLILGLPRDCIYNMDKTDRMYPMTEVIRTRVSDLKLDEAPKNLLLDSLTINQEQRGNFAYFKTILEAVKMNLAVNTKIEDRIQKILRRAPEELYDIYKEILNDCRNISRAQKLLHLVLASFEPLSIQSLYTALELLDTDVSGVLEPAGKAVEPEDDEGYQQILYMDCGFFFTVVRGRVYLFDPAMRDFLLPSKLPTRQGSNSTRTEWQHAFNPRNSHTVMHTACLNCLGRSFHSLHSVPSQDNDPFYIYAASRWLQHHSLGPFETIHLGSSEARSLLIDLPIMLPLATKGLTDLSSALFWQWFVHSGVEKTLLSHNWATWLMLLIKDAGNITLDSKALEAAFYKKNDLPNCRLCRKFDCEYLNVFYCSDELKFKEQFEINCGEEYDIFRLREERAEQEQGRKKLPQGDLDDQLQKAAFYGDLLLTRELINNGANVNALGPSDGNALRAASANGHAEVVLTLLDQGAEVNAQEGSPSALHEASIGGHDKVVRILLDRGADLNAQDKHNGSALGIASNSGYEGIVQLLLEHGADVNALDIHHGSALHAAILYGHEGIVQLLLKHGADVNAPDKHHGNALQTALIFSREKIIRVLLERGADVSALDKHRASALHTAILYGHKGIVQLLLEHGVDVNALYKHHGSALLAAIRRSHVGIIQLLLEHGADVNAPDKHHGSALQAASTFGHEKIIQVLLEHGADVNAYGGPFGSALQAASTRGHEKAVQLLLDRGADVNAHRGLGQEQRATSEGDPTEVEGSLLREGHANPK